MASPLSIRVMNEANNELTGIIGVDPNRDSLGSETRQTAGIIHGRET